MSVDITTETVIDRPRDVVAAYAADPSNAPEWYDNIDTLEWKSEPVVAVGSKAAFVARFLGRRLEYTNRGELRGFSTLVAPLMAPAMRRANRKDLAKLKMVLERDAT